MCLIYRFEVDGALCVVDEREEVFAAVGCVVVFCVTEHAGADAIAGALGEGAIVFDVVLFVGGHNLTSSLKKSVFCNYL